MTREMTGEMTGDKTGSGHLRVARLLALLAGLAGLGVVLPAWAQAPAPADPNAPAPKKRRLPPPAVIPIEDTAAAQKLYGAGSYEASVAQAKVALTKNEKYTPAMLVMAKAYYRLRKYEWVSHLWKMMQSNNASDAEKAEMYHLLAWMEMEKNNVRGSIEMLAKATEARPENSVLWNNLGAQYLEAKNYKDAAPALEKAVQLNPTFAKAFVNLGSAYRGMKAFDRAQSSYERALQLFPNYADAVFHLGILYLDADGMQGVDTIARLNTAIGHFLRYKQMMGGLIRQGDPVEAYVAEAQEKITKEQKRIERQKKQEERDRARAAAKPAPGAAQPAAAPANPGGAPAPAVGAPHK